MSAADLFKDAWDAEFRLKGTFIMVGKKPYFVRNVMAVGGSDTATALLILSDDKDDEFHVALGRLPLSAMTACPQGYHDGVWYTRGPARHRYQGITGSSFWAVMHNGVVDPCGTGNTQRLLSLLARQPKKRRPGKRPTGILTKDVYIEPGSNRVLIQGRHRAMYEGRNLIKPIGEISPIHKKFLDNAKLGLIGIDEPVEDIEYYDEASINPMAEQNIAIPIPAGWESFMPHPGPSDPIILDLENGGFETWSQTHD